jgi:hypothetical protein
MHACMHAGSSSAQLQQQQLRSKSTGATGVRVEKDTMGALEVPADRCVSVCYVVSKQTTGGWLAHGR